MVLASRLNEQGDAAGVHTRNPALQSCQQDASGQPGALRFLGLTASRPMRRIDSSATTQPNGEDDMKKFKPDRAFAASPVSTFKMLGLCCDDAHSGATC